MKKHLLFFGALFTAAISFAQFNQGNEPVIGNTSVLYVIDSMAPNMNTEVGAGSTWDYSSYGGYNGETRALAVVDPTATPNSAEYPSATKALEIQDFLLNYISSTTSERTSHGFVYTDSDASFGDIIVVFDIDPASQYLYPFNVGNSLTDNFSGDATFTINGNTQTAPASGKITTEVDGSGTLKLANGVDVTNITRYKLEDSTTVNVPFLGQFVLERTQFEYYDLANSNLPVFIHTHVKIDQGGAVLSEFSLVMSKEDPLLIADIETNELANTQVYPNPANKEINIKLAEAGKNIEVRMVDAMGREVLNQELNAIDTKVNVDHLENGMYILHISNGSAVETKNIIIE